MLLKEGKPIRCSKTECIFYNNGTCPIYRLYKGCTDGQHK